MQIVFIILEFAIVLGFMVLVHEFGHFAVAKLCGVKVETFSIGFGPRILGFKYGETDYRLSILPLGGYVKMAGEMTHEGPSALADGIPGEGTTDGRSSRDFSARPRWQRVLIALAGPCANFILSFILLALVAHYHHEVQQYRTGAAVVDYVPANSAAARAGLAIGDTIISYDGKQNPNWDVVLEETALNLNHPVALSFLHNGQRTDTTLQLSTPSNADDFGADTLSQIGLIPREQTTPLGLSTIAPGTPADRAGLKAGDQIALIDQIAPHSLDTMHYYLRDRSGAPATLQVLRNGQPLTFNLVPERIDGAPSYAQWQIGFQTVPTPVDVEKLPAGAAIVQSLKDNADNSKLILRVLQGMFTRHVSVKSLSGPVGIAQEIHFAFNLGMWPVFQLMANISTNLGIFNLLPIPILDGGMILFLLIEAIMRRDVNEVLKERIYQVAFVCIILFAVFVLFNDVTKLHLGHP